MTVFVQVSLYSCITVTHNILKYMSQLCFGVIGKKVNGPQVWPYYTAIYVNMLLIIRVDDSV